MDKYVIINVANEEFGICIENVTSIEKVTTLTSIPNMEEYLRGIVNIRGSIIPVIDTSQLFFSKPTELSDNARFIMVKTESMNICLLADNAKEILEFQDDDIKPFSQISSSSSFFEGVKVLQGRLISIINLSEMLHSLSNLEAIRNEVKLAALGAST